MTPTISYLEVGTALLLLVGLLVIGRALYLVVGDLARVKRKKDFVKNGIRHLQAKARVRTEVRKFISMSLFLLAVVMLMDVPPRPGKYSFATLTVMVAILTTISMMIIDTLFYLLERDRILEMLDERAKVEALEAPLPKSTVKIHGDGHGTLQVPVEIEREL